MPTFLFRGKIPSCLVTKDLLSGIETYLNVEMRQKLGETLGDKITYQVSIKEKIGTETLASVSEYSPGTFSDGTKEIAIRWENGYEANCQLDIAIDLDGSFGPISALKVKCTAPTARETAIGVGEAILRLLKSYRTYNWIFNPSDEFPIVSYLAGIGGLALLVSGSG